MHLYLGFMEMRHAASTELAVKQRFDQIWDLALKSRWLQLTFMHSSTSPDDWFLEELERELLIPGKLKTEQVNANGIINPFVGHWQEGQGGLHESDDFLTIQGTDGTTEESWRIGNEGKKAEVQVRATWRMLF